MRIPSLVVTLGTTSLMTGIVQWMTNSSTIGGIDNALIMSVVAAASLGVPYAFYYAIRRGDHHVLRLRLHAARTRRLLFVGRGREVARLNGIAVDRVRLGALLTSGIMSAGAGILYAGVLGSADPYSWPQLPPAGLRRRLPRRNHHPARALQPLGRDHRRLFLATGITGLTMLGIPLWVTNVFNGGALILAVTISQFTRRREASDIG